MSEGYKTSCVECGTELLVKTVTCGKCTSDKSATSDHKDNQERYLTNCDHSEEGWCLSCVKAMHAELEECKSWADVKVAGRMISTNLIEIAMEQRDPAKWAAMMLIKGGNDPSLTCEDATALIEGTLRHALQLMLDAEREKCDRERHIAAQAFLEEMGEVVEDAD